MGAVEIRLRSAGGRARGFTLLELLVVLVIAGIMLGVVSLSAIPGRRQQMQNEAQRIALLMQTARDEAIVRNRPVEFEADSDGYRFLVRETNQWQPINDDEILRARTFKHAPVALLLSPPSPGGTQPLRIVFGREPVDKPFLLTLSSGRASASVRADGIGHFTVE